MRFFALLILLVGSFELVAQRTHLDFDADWRFHFGHAGDPRKDFNYSIAPIFSKSGKAETTAIDTRFDDSNWKKLDLPHDWAVALPFSYHENFDVQSHGYKPVGGLYPETSIGWYRKHFVMTLSDSGSRYSIQFDGVFRNSKVWLNGFYLGTHESGYTSFEYDITDYLNFQGDNVLVVRVDATQYEGWFYEGAGIYRHVWLNKFSSVHIANNGGVFAWSEEVNQLSATVTVETVVTNEDLTGEQSVQVLTTLVDRNGKIVASSEATPAQVLRAGTDMIIRQRLLVANPIRWSLENPYLYRVRSQVQVAGRVTDQVSTRFGIRTLAFAPDHSLLLNGKMVKIQGVNCHQDHAGVGSALPDYLQYYRIRLLKEMGVTAYRTSHHPPTPELLDACDSLGMLVLDETRLSNSSPEYMTQLEDLIRRDRNRASVFMWSIGNEEGYIQTNSYGKRIALSLLARQRQLDPTRTSTYAADLGNYFPGINEVIPVRGFNYREKFVVPYHHDHPHQPVVGTEMGSTVTTRGIYAVDSLKGYLPDQDISAPWWASTAEAWWPTAATNNWYMGGFIWTGFDYRGEPTPFKWPNINSHFGVMDVCGFPKNIYYYYQSWWTSNDVLHITPHWNWKGQEGKRMDVWVNSNADQVELMLNGKSLGKKTMPRNSHLKWLVAYKPGTLEAVAWKNGRKFKTQVVTTGAPYAVKLTSDRSWITADGKDASVINVTVLDKEGREVPDAASLIHFTITGSGRAIGVGNGDPSSHEADQYDDPAAYKRSLFGGKCQIIVQSSRQPGALTIEASSAGLQPATVTLQVK